MKNKMVKVFALLFAAMMIFTGCSKSNTPDAAAEALNVDGVSVPLGEVNFWLRYQQAGMQGMYASLFGEDFMNQDMMGTGSVYGESIRDMVLDMLEEYYVVAAHAEELGVSLSDEEKQAAADAAAAFTAANSSETLSAMTADEATVAHVLELAALQNKVYKNRAATIDRTVDPEEAAQKRISYVFTGRMITDEAGNRTEPTEEELAEKKALMETILREAKESKDLGTAAAAHDMSTVPATYGRDDTSLDEALHAAVDNLKEGEFTEVVETDAGFYVACMESTHDEEATQSKTESILAARGQEAYSSWLDPLKEAAAITVNEAVVGTLTFERKFDAAVPETDTEAGEDNPNTKE